MRPNGTKRTLSTGKPALGIMISSVSPLAAEMVANAGFDWAMVDLQHGEADLAHLTSLLQAISTTGTTPFVRVPLNDFVSINRALDLGAYGIVVPLVNTPEEAAAAVRAAKYPPMGARSSGPIRAAVYGGDGYFQGTNTETSLFVMIETVEAVRNVRAIVATAGVDGCYVGPSDMTISHGGEAISDTGPLLRDDVEEAMKTVVAACQEVGKIAGIHVGSAEGANRRLGQGFRFVSINNELGLMTKAMRGELAHITR